MDKKRLALTTLLSALGAALAGVLESQIETIKTLLENHAMVKGLVVGLIIFGAGAIKSWLNPPQDPPALEPPK